MSKPTPHQSSELLEKNKKLVRNFIEDTLNSHDVSTADKYFGQDPKTEGFKQYRRNCGISLVIYPHIRQESANEWPYNNLETIIMDCMRQSSRT
jgi:hypothetical protein